MYGKVIVGLCLVAATASLVLGAPHHVKTEESLAGTTFQPTIGTTLKTKVSKLEEVHVCVPNDSCGHKNVVGIKVEYTCQCNPGYNGQYCDQSSNFAVQKPQLRSFVDLTHTQIKANQLFYCEYQNTNCVNGVSVIQDKKPICG